MSPSSSSASPEKITFVSGKSDTKTISAPTGLPWLPEGLSQTMNKKDVHTFSSLLNSKKPSFLADYIPSNKSNKVLSELNDSDQDTDLSNDKPKAPSKSKKNDASQVSENEEEDIKAPIFRAPGPAESILGNAINNYQAAVPFAAVEIPPQQQIKQLSNEIIERLLVSNSKDTNKPEVMILFNSNVLEATNVRIAKVGEILDIFFYTSSSQSASLLNQNEAALRKQLQEALTGTKINIQLENQSHDRGQEGNQHKKGRNVMEYQEEA